MVKYKKSNSQEVKGLFTSSTTSTSISHQTPVSSLKSINIEHCQYLHTTCTACCLCFPSSLTNCANMSTYITPYLTVCIPYTLSFTYVWYILAISIQNIKTTNPIYSFYLTQPLLFSYPCKILYVHLYKLVFICF